MKLAENLIEHSTPEQFDFAQFKDDYTDKMRELIEKKVTGQEIVAPPAEQPTQIINLMDALKQSLAKVQPAGDAKPPSAQRSEGACSRAEEEVQLSVDSSRLR